MISKRSPLWLRPHLLGMDAAAVALVWQAEWAGLLGSLLRWWHVAALGSAVWSVYLLDRVADARRDPEFASRTARHAYAARQPKRLAALGLAVGLGGFVSALACLSGRELFAGFALAAVAVAYFLAVHRAQLSAGGGPVKELAVGLIFAAGTALFPLLNRTTDATAVVGPLIGFAALGFFNGLLISHWECGRFRPAGVSFAFAGLVAAAAAIWAWDGDRVWLALASAAGLHLALHLARDRFGADARRAAVDVCLLTPLLV